MLPRPATFAWEVHEFIKLTKKGIDRFNDLIQAQDWSMVTFQHPNVEDMVSRFQSILYTHVSSCFSWKRVRRKSNESPWLTDGLRSQMKKRICIFRTEGRSPRWKRVDASIKRTLEMRKSNYFEQEADKLKALGKGNSWYKILSRMTDDDAPPLWSISELEPEKDPKTLAEELK